MKNKDLSLLKEKSIETLRKTVSELNSEITKSRTKIYTGQEKNNKASRNNRRKLATTLTIIREKELKL